MPVSGSGAYTALVKIADRRAVIISSGATPGVTILTIAEAVEALGSGGTARVSGLFPNLVALGSALLAAGKIDVSQWPAGNL